MEVLARKKGKKIGRMINKNPAYNKTIQKQTANGKGKIEDGSQCYKHSHSRQAGRKRIVRTRDTSAPECGGTEIAWMKLREGKTLGKILQTCILSIYEIEKCH